MRGGPTSGQLESPCCARRSGSKTPRRLEQRNRENAGPGWGKSSHKITDFIPRSAGCGIGAGGSGAAGGSWDDSPQPGRQTSRSLDHSRARNRWGSERPGGQRGCADRSVGSITAWGFQLSRAPGGRASPHWTLLMRGAPLGRRGKNPTEKHIFRRKRPTLRGDPEKAVLS